MLGFPRENQLFIVYYVSGDRGPGRFNENENCLRSEPCSGRSNVYTGKQGLIQEEGGGYGITPLPTHPRVLETLNKLSALTGSITFF